MPPTCLQTRRISYPRYDRGRGWSLFLSPAPRGLACVCIFDTGCFILGPSLQLLYSSKAIEIELHLNIQENLQFVEIIRHVSLCSVSTEKQKSTPTRQNTAVNSSSRNHSATVIPPCLRLHGSLAGGWCSSGAGRAPHAPPLASRCAHWPCARGPALHPCSPSGARLPLTMGWLFLCIGGGGCLTLTLLFL